MFRWDGSCLVAADSLILIELGRPAAPNLMVSLSFGYYYCFFLNAISCLSQMRLLWPSFLSSNHMYFYLFCTLIWFKMSGLFTENDGNIFLVLSKCSRSESVNSYFTSSQLSRLTAILFGFWTVLILESMMEPFLSFLGCKCITLFSYIYLSFFESCEVIRSRF